MPRRYFGFLASILLLPVLFASEARAAGNLYAKIMLHGLLPTAKAPCTRSDLLPANCTGFRTNNMPLYPETRFAYVLVVDGSLLEGVAGLQFGIDYPGGADGATDGAGLEIWDWNLCATLEFQSPPGGAINPWPNPDSGTLITWDATTRCQTTGNASVGVVAVAGYFYCGAYSPALLRIVPRQVDGQAKVSNCGSVEDVVYTSPSDFGTHLGALGFGQAGINPCGRVACGCSPVEPTTWSAVKTLSQ